MKTVKDDRRSKRTRQLLGSALVELMLEKRYNTITVQDILDRANIGRSTFYAHYSDKEDLLISEIERVIQELEKYTSGHMTGTPLPSLEFFRHLQQQRRLIHAFVWGPAGERLMKDFQARVSKIVEQNLSLLAGDEATFSLPLSLVANFVTSTLVLLLQWWFEQDLRSSPEEMDEMFRKLVMPAIHAVLMPQNPPST